MQTHAIIRVQGRCLIDGDNTNTRAPTPKKPYFIKSLLKAGYGGEDGPFTVRDRIFTAEEIGQDVLADTIKGEGKHSLPVIFVSRLDDNTLPIDEVKLSRDVAGLAHVVVESTRMESFDLMERTGGANPYGGAIGICLSGNGVVARYLLGTRYISATDLMKVVALRVSNLAATRASLSGWDWQDIQTKQAETLRSKLESVETEVADKLDRIYRERIETLRERVEELESKVKDMSVKNDGDSFSALATKFNVDNDFIYDGELEERLAHCLHIASNNTKGRSKLIADFILGEIITENRASRLVDQIKNASKDTTAMPKRLGALLKGIGYISRTDGKHTVYKPSDRMRGINQLTVPTTPSEYRSGPNTGAQAIKALGLNELKGERSQSRRGQDHRRNRKSKVA